MQHRSKRKLGSCYARKSAVGRVETGGFGSRLLPHLFAAVEQLNSRGIDQFRDIDYDLAVCRSPDWRPLEV